MADIEVDRGFIEDEEGIVDILHSPFFDHGFGGETIVQEYVNRILYTLGNIMDSQLLLEGLYIVCRPCFTSVTENGKQERHLVATVGKFSVIWNFLQVKKSSHECYRNQEGLKSCYCYRIVPKDESIVDSRFMHEKFAGTDSPDAPLVVATSMKVSSFSISARR